MVDIAKTKEQAIEIAQIIDENKGIDTVVLYIGDQSSFTDYFVITTVSSNAHVKGLGREIKNYFSDHGIHPLHKTKSFEGENWVLIDCGNIVIHLMDREMREFYDLERLWYSGVPVYHSSKSSKSNPSS
jgi:ribosome-associated protein